MDVNQIHCGNYFTIYTYIQGFLGHAVIKNSPAGDARDLGSIPDLRRSSGGGNGNLLQ